ncbi:MAG: pyruvate dehydrogenase component beta subunit [Baekduia sp.]|jgi:pyruvate dehydrogenase E1 component beta subunit|nr:pyruvate dehydrogenase component beta subunit [Baekduia sp.]
MSRIVTYRDALNEALREELARDDAVFLMGQDLGAYGGAFGVTKGLMEEFGGRRVRDTPISENTIAGLGVGAAMAGLRPVVEIMSVNFALLAMDQIVNHAAQVHAMTGGAARVPIVFRMPQGAGGQLGPMHSHTWEALFLHAPGLLVAAPSTAADAKGLLKTAIRDDNPVVFLEHERLYGQRSGVDAGDGLVPFGRAIVRHAGTDVTLVGVSRMAVVAWRAAEVLAAEHGISAEAIDPRTLRPLDLDTIVASVCKTGRCVVVEEGWPDAGVGATLAAALQEQAFGALTAPVLRVSGAPTPMPYNKGLEREAVPGEAAVVAAALDAVGYATRRAVGSPLARRMARAGGATLRTVRTEDAATE